MSLTLLEAAKAKLEGKRVEYSYGSIWKEWDGTVWSETRIHRIAPEPKKRVKLLAYLDSCGELRRVSEDSPRKKIVVAENWVRVPAEDKEVEIET